MNQQLIDKYNVPVPRYTSYPPANYFGTFGSEEYLQAVSQSNKAHNDNISFYLHMPFCRHLCHYCACNSYSMAHGDTMKRYVDAVHKEIDMITPFIDNSRKISQIHYGGGSPTAVPANLIKEINEHLLSVAATIDRPEIAIECHPGYLDENGWQALVDCGFNRYSIGVQDFNENVLKTVNRRPSLLPMETVFRMLRGSGATINMDFLYGLPGQTPDSFLSSIKRAIMLRPDRLVTFSYAHVPWVNKRQIILEKAGLPSSVDKELMFDKASIALREAGYQSVGLDHFVQPDDELFVALRNKQLHRNFQGYCTRRTTGQVYAFGVTGISQLEGAYAQNGKDIEEYISTINNGDLYIRKGYRMKPDEMIIREVIESLMCNYYINWTSLAEMFNVSIDELKATTAFDENKIRGFVADGLISCSEDYLQMTSAGTPFVRNVAASLDPLMTDTKRSFSKPI